MAEQVRTRQRWTAEDYDLMERLAPLGMSAREMSRYFSPQPDGEALRSAAARAGISLGWRAGQPSRADRERWEQIRAELLGAKDFNEEKSE